MNQKLGVINLRKHLQMALLNGVPVLSGLIGKIALVSSFALLWSQELEIVDPNFVLNNVRLELLIGSSVSLLAVWLCPKAAPAGTLAPLLVMIPAMASVGVHPFYLGIAVAVIGGTVTYFGLLDRLVKVTGAISRSSIALTFGISGIAMSFMKLRNFFEGKVEVLVLLLLILAAFFVILSRLQKGWLMVPISVIASLMIPYSAEMQILAVDSHDKGWFVFSGGINYGLMSTWGEHLPMTTWSILGTIFYAILAVIIWAIDISSIRAVSEATEYDTKLETFAVKETYLLVALRNLIGSFLGGAQTASVWRSFLIPLYSMKLPMKFGTVLLGVSGIAVALMTYPIQIVSYIPVVWTVLLFGIYVPLVVAGAKGVSKLGNGKRIWAVLIMILGIFTNPIWQWVIGIFLDYYHSKRRNNS